jgi:hypothetical protein
MSFSPGLRRKPLPWVRTKLKRNNPARGCVYAEIYEKPSICGLNPFRVESPVREPLPRVDACASTLGWGTLPLWGNNAVFMPLELPSSVHLNGND